MIRILYIAGYGRSGSTILERVLSSHPAVYGTGELHALPELVDSGHKPEGYKYRLRDLEFWTHVVDKVRDECDPDSLCQLRNNLESWRGIGLLGGATSGKMEKAYCAYMSAVLEGIEEQLPSDIKFIVDSSKSARMAAMRPIALHRLCNVEIRVVHLVRDMRGCIWSSLRGSNFELARGARRARSFPIVRTAVGWNLANIAAELARWEIGKDSYHRIRYEDFVTSPRSALKDLGEGLGLDLSEQISRIESRRSFPLANQIAGNRSKDQERPIELDDEWRERLPLPGSIAFWLTGGPLAARYGYL